MKTKRTMVILIATVFVFVLLFSCILLFSVKKVDAEFSVATDIDTKELEEKLSDFCGENLLFFDKNEVVELVENYPYFELVSVEKKFPNIITVSVKERIETYYILTVDKVLITDKDGIVLNVKEKSEFDYNIPREIITLTADGITFSEQNLGKKVVCDNAELLDIVFEMAKSVDLTDCIKSIHIVTAKERDDVSFSTYTGVNILVTQATVRGVDKINTGFSAYNDRTDDYLKTYNNIEVVLKDDGKIVAVWTDKG